MSEDAVSFLERQHGDIRNLFDELKSGGENREETFQCLVRLLAVHETAEEMVIYPAVRAKVPEGSSLVEPRLEEEDAAKQMLSDLEKLGPEGEGFDAKLAAFQAAVLDHAAREEREIFPALREHLDADRLENLRTALVAAEAIAPTHPHPHGPESAIGNLMVGPFVAVVDRVRDAISAIKD